ncbi:MAG: hypothetical protein LBF62_02180, partial [Tannerellaceae bacterium]|nr:hypothetical protein [Tannerellaceae bacterium]
GVRQNSLQIQFRQFLSGKPAAPGVKGRALGASPSSGGRGAGNGLYAAIPCAGHAVALSCLPANRRSKSHHVCNVPVTRRSKSHHACNVPAVRFCVNPGFVAWRCFAEGADDDRREEEDLHRKARPPDTGGGCAQISYCIKKRRDWVCREFCRTPRKIRYYYN